MQERRKFTDAIYKPQEQNELFLFSTISKTIDTTLKKLPPLKRRQVSKILSTVETSPISYIKAFSPYQLVRGTPGGGFFYLNKKLVLHPSWANHPLSYLLAVHEFEHILYFTDRYIPGDRFIKILFHYLIHPKSFRKRIEEKAIKETKKFIRKNYSFDYYKTLETKLPLSPPHETIRLLRENEILDSRHRVNTEKVFSIPNHNLVNAYKTWEKAVYNERYLKMIQSGIKKSDTSYISEELRKYRSSTKKLLQEYILKFIFWAAFTGSCSCLFFRLFT